MADNKKTNWLTTEQNPQKPIQKRHGEVREKRSYSEKTSESNTEKYRQGGKIFESQGPSKPKK